VIGFFGNCCNGLQFEWKGRVEQGAWGYGAQQKMVVELAVMGGDQIFRELLRCVSADWVEGAS
jgi:hypothetical protein